MTLNESETELEYIDPALKKAGWGVVEGSRIRKQFPITQGRLIGQGRRDRPLKADYVLQYKNCNLAVIEAKAFDKYYTDGVGQAKDYAQRLQIRYTYSTNGREIYHIDMDEGKEGDITRYPTPDELWEITFPKPVTEKAVEIADWKERFSFIPFEGRGGTWQPRYYQENAINKTLEAVAAGKNRILLTLATGTGKTAISFQIAWKLFQSRWNLKKDGIRRPRILFLADRNILADQAFNSYTAFEEDALVRISPEDIRKKGKVPTNGSIFFTIFQTFMSGPDNSPYFGEYPKDFFDFIIIDECHRGGANDESTWRSILEYFSPAIQLGLTATPKRDVNVDTYRYFGEPVYIYSLKEGINDGFLTPFRVKEISTTGDTYTYTTDDTVIEGEIEKDRKYNLEDQNRIIQLMDVERYRVKIFMDMINQNQKTLVFCATQIHAAAVRDLINQYARNKNPNYCHRVTADDGEIGDQHMRDFQDNEKSIPTVLTTSQKLSTGVDAPEIRNIVLMRPINSMVEFKQIIGRGTRLYDGKDFFTIYDFVKAHNHFNDDEWDGEPLDPSPPIYEPPKSDDTPVISYPDSVCPVCGKYPCTCEGPQRMMIRVKLSDNKIRELDSMVKTTFWSPEGTPISAEEFVKQLFGDIPAFFKDENELRKLWSNPNTRKELLNKLSEKGYSINQLEELSKLVHGEDSDLYDVLAYVAYHRNLVPRFSRAKKAKSCLDSYNDKQQDFLNFVLEQYVKEGVGELDVDKLPSLLTLKYKAVTDGITTLGDVSTIRKAFIDFQACLYQPIAIYG
jgi:type I restriction enzyme R subunit